MRKSEVVLKIQAFERALERLKEAVERAVDDLDKDGVIQRFEFTVELLWKTLKAVLEYHGVECYSPRNCIKEAFKANLIDDDEIIFDMLEDRNLSSHVYSKEMSEKIFERIKNVYLEYLERLDLRARL
ncbi:nucleotidyltransferase, substrate-binding protein [Thermosulfidibacter takaii ABI70S6]|uniref:Nucleotidyltransferase, substrate-binding protein n=1 Tax=Thermosulfidibacter takaii (strain DSM 17441 / JCM 13301 / NBRC 103674 / ABI70S6) TaxID=1298851 RepID=A0A0S3QRW6_THET7|nr:nucleotidyltransferase substrate binding protein [Thermosulfidibacter takaii]BAT71062.1 nucleotidyltransferase, substrate-binding protein [Thermosulfidibacter takaii ABI70S6]